MTAGETLLKVADYPFAYSFVILVGGIFGFGLSENKILILGLAGALGTFLTIVDPWGLYVRWQLNRGLNKIVKTRQIFPDLKYYAKALNSRSIGIEIDRIIGMFYFAIIIFVFMVTIWWSSSFTNNLVIRDTYQNILLGDLHVRVISSIVAIIALWILAIISRRKWRELDKKLEVAAMHQFSIGNEYATKATIENMTRAVDLGDWASAEEWAQELKEEIDNKKGKREIIIKSAELIFRPLHEDSMNIELSYQGILNAKNYYGITSNIWDQLKRSGTHLMIEDADLRHRIENFYKKTLDYNKLASQINADTDELIKESMSTVFGRKVKSIRYLTKHRDAVQDPILIGCALFNIHPIDHVKEVERLQVDIQFSGEESMNAHKDDEDFKKFDDGWKMILQSVNEDKDVQKLKSLLNEIMIENNKLLSVYKNRIEMQWRV